jgi:hypothetical protein
LTPIVVGVGFTLGFLAALFALAIVGFLVWWRSLFRGASPTAARLGRTVRLGIWTGTTPRREQTPYEYADQLGVAVPDASAPLHELTDLYVRERWGGQPHPPTTSAPLYERARVALTRAIVGRWREIPRQLLSVFLPLLRYLSRLRDGFMRGINRMLDAMAGDTGR